MRTAIVILLTGIAALAATDPWAKVRDLKTGTEVRIFKKGAVKAILATLDEANDDNLIVVVKNEEIAIPREDVDRLDYRPKQTAPTVSKETHTTESGPEGGAPPPLGSPEHANTGSTSSGTSYSFGSKPDFQTIYRRPPPMPKKD